MVLYLHTHYDAYVKPWASQFCIVFYKCLNNKYLLRHTPTEWKILLIVAFYWHYYKLVCSALYELNYWKIGTGFVSAYTLHTFFFTSDKKSKNKLNGLCAGYLFSIVECGHDTEKKPTRFSRLWVWGSWEWNKTTGCKSFTHPSTWQAF